MKQKILILVLAIVGVSLALMSSCIDRPEQLSPEEVLQKNLAAVDQVQLQKDIKTIDDSLAKWGITPQVEPNGVRYVINIQGSGPKPTLKSYITFNYKGSLLTNRSVFDQGNTTYPLNYLITGWQTTLPLINQGSKVTMYVPSGLAYGNNETIDPVDHTVTIPRNANLIFEIDLLGVQ